MAGYSKEEIRKIEDKWREKWVKQSVYKTSEDPSKPKYYVLDMFPYPSGAGLHVGHPLGYIGSDIVARFKRNKGFNVLHPMGFDAFGLPAEQYAIQTGQHPAITTAKNIETFKKQLGKIGLSYDWDREVQTSDPDYYKWTQWIFMQLFNAWYNKKSDKTETIELLVAEFEKKGNKNIDAVCDEETPLFTSAEWSSFDEKQKENVLQKYRIAYQSETMVNWCAALGTVLSNDEVKDGVSERGGYPVERIRMLQWSMRITAYAERLLSGLNTIDWPEPLKEMQRNWIGKSEGAKITFSIKSEKSTAVNLIVFTTRPDTIFGVDFMVVAPELEIVKQITSDVQKQEVDKYLKYVESRSEVDRLADVKKITGCFTGAYAINPFNKREIPIWISEYVLAGYGTGAIMAVPCGDERDHKFATHFNLPITNIIGSYYNGVDANPTYDAILENSDFLNGMTMKAAIPVVINKLEKLGIGVRKVNYRMHDAIFGRQRYWGEPFPVYFKDGIPKLVDVNDLRTTLPEIDEYKPTETGEPPLARAKDWRYIPRLNPLSKGLPPGPSPGERGGLTPGPSPGERGRVSPDDETSTRGRETANKAYWHILESFSKENRRNQTKAESILWEEVRGSKLGFKIRRQHAIGDFVADFVCLDKRLVIEVDGEYHAQSKEYDMARTEFLKSEGFNVIRFTNAQVQYTLPQVLAEIKSTLEKSSSLKDVASVAHSSPLPRRGDGGEAHSSPLPRRGEGGEASPKPGPSSIAHSSPLLRRGDGGEAFELTTMPGWAGSSWYSYRSMNPHNNNEFCSREKESYWKDVDLYIGGSEHATGHLMYSRFWNKALKDLGFANAEEPFRKLINQGHIQGVSKLAYRINGTNKFVSYNLRNDYEVTPLHVDISFVDGDVLDIEKFKAWRGDFKNI